MGLPDHLIVLKESMYYMYVLKSLDSKDYYVGYSANLRKRIEAHKSAESRFGKQHKQIELIYYEAYISESLARQREAKLKNNRRMKQLLIERLSGQGSS